MKSTKIEDLEIEEVVERRNNDDINDINDINDMDVNDELKIQLESLKSELKDMKSEKRVISENDSSQSEINNVNDTQQSENRMFGIIDKLVTISYEDVKECIILLTLYVFMNSSKIHDLIDNIIPFSIYTYSFLVKAIVFIFVYKMLQKMI
jgi:hypothetical protein